MMMGNLTPTQLLKCNKEHAMQRERHMDVVSPNLQERVSRGREGGRVPTWTCESKRSEP